MTACYCFETKEGMLLLQLTKQLDVSRSHLLLNYSFVEEALT